MTRVLADLDVEVTTPEGERVTVLVHSDGRTVRVRSEGWSTLLAGRSTGELNTWAARLAEHSMVLELDDGDGAVMRIGDVGAPWWQRIVSRSRHVRIVRWKAATAFKAAALSGNGVGLVPPPIEWPELPQTPWFARKVSTTHDPYGGGHPRLYLSDTRVPATGRPVQMMPLWPGEVTIGSGDDTDLTLDGMDPLQAVVTRTEDDEYVLHARSEQVPTVVHGMHTPEYRLRTGTRIEIGPWRLTYVRDEYADHGRPHGGRIGGELGVQHPQPVPQYQR